MSPKSKAQNELIRQRSMQAIKEVALELFAHKGYHSTSISQIAKAAGVSKGLMYNYFSSKEELLETIVLELVEVGNQMIELLQQEEDPFEQLKKMTDMSFMMVASDLQHWKLMSSLAFQTDTLTNLEPKLHEMHQTGIRLMTDLFQRLGMDDPEEEAYLYGAMIDGVILHYMQFEDKYPLEKMKNFILKRYLK
jgi:AcrR family transcriptional regulator